MKKLIVSILIIGLLAVLSGCTRGSGQDSKISYKDIKPVEAKKMFESEENVMLLDVRTQQEYNEGHIPKSVLIPLDRLSDSVESKIPDKKTKLLVYCRSGNRSRQAADILVSKGYENVYNLGGIIDWPYDIEK